MASSTKENQDTQIALATTANEHLFALMGALEDLRDWIIAIEGYLTTANGQLAEMVAASEAQRIEVVGVATKVEQQRIDSLAATELVRIATAEVAAKVEQQRVDLLAAQETTRIAQVQALHGLPH